LRLDYFTYAQQPIFLNFLNTDSPEWNNYFRDYPQSLKIVAFHCDEEIFFWNI